MKDTIRQMVTPRALLRPPVSRVVPTPAGTRTASADSDREGERDFFFHSTQQLKSGKKHALFSPLV